MPSLDRRLHAFRADLADAALRDRVEAEHFVDGEPAVVRVRVTDLRPSSDAQVGIDTQLLFGEAVTVFERKDGWAWVQNRRDGYVGYLRETALAEGGGAATHEVVALRTFRYPRPDLKAPAVGALSFTSPLRVLEEENGFVRVEHGDWVFAEHLAAVGDYEPDHLATALRFVGMPYRWGGREAIGLDCSALVQLALQRAGRACPRDSDMQRSLGEPVSPDEPPRRGDVLCMPGHVVLALDAETVVNATAHGMRVRVEPLSDVVARSVADTGRGVIAARRLAWAGPHADR